MVGRGWGRGRGNRSSSAYVPSTISSPIPDIITTPQDPSIAPATTINPYAPATTTTSNSFEGVTPSSNLPPTSTLEAASPSEGAFENPELPPNPISSLTIKPFPKGKYKYTPNQPGAHGVLCVIKTTLREPYTSWTHVPPEKRNELFQEWKKYVNYEPQYESFMRGAFEEHIKARLPDVYSEIRKAGKKPVWMFPDTYEALCKHWETASWKKMSDTNKKNRASPLGGSLHAGGSISTATLYENHRKKTGSEPDDAEMLLLCKQRKADQTFLEPRAEKSWNNYMDMLKRHEAESAEEGIASTQQSRNELFAQAIGGRNNKGRMYSINYMVGGSSHGHSHSSGSQECTSSHPSGQVELQLQDLKANQEKQRECQEKQTDAIQRIEQMLSGFMSLLGGIPHLTNQTPSKLHIFTQISLQMMERTMEMKEIINY